MAKGSPHYTNSKVSMNMHEPVYLNLWELIVTPPSETEKWDELSLENIKKITGLDTDQLPEPVTQIYKGAQRSFAGSLPAKTTVDIATEWEVNVDDNLSMFVYKSLRNWCNLIWNPLDGSMTVKKKYAGGPMLITLYQKEFQPLRQWKFSVVFPITPINPMDLDYANGTTIYSCSMTFRSDFWDDITV